MAFKEAFYVLCLLMKAHTLNDVHFINFGSYPASFQLSEFVFK